MVLPPAGGARRESRGFKNGERQKKAPLATGAKGDDLCGGG